MTCELTVRENMALSAGGSNISSSTRWYATYTCARHEKHVRRQLEERGISCSCLCIAASGAGRIDKRN